MKKLRLLPVFAVLAGVALPCAASAQPFLGQVVTVPYSFCPVGWAQMNGAVLPIAGYPDLFILLGNTYGGDGQTSFALPSAIPQFNVDGRPMRQCIATSGIYPSAP